MITNYDYMQMQMKDVLEGHILGQNKNIFSQNFSCIEKEDLQAFLTFSLKHIPTFFVINKIVSLHVLFQYQIIDHKKQFSEI